MLMQKPVLPHIDYQPKPYAGPPADEILRLRKQFLNPGIFLYYKKPIMLVEGKMQYEWDESGKRYLDAHGGNAVTMGLTAHRTWKFNVPHSFGVHHAITPDPYRGLWGRDDVDAGKQYAADVKNLLDFATSGQVAGFIAESIQGVGGCVVF